MDRDGLEIDCGTAFGHRIPGASYSCDPRPNEAARWDGVESTTTCEAGGLDIRHWPKRQKWAAVFFALNVPPGATHPVFIARINS